MTEKFLRCLLAAVSSERPTAKEFLIIGKAINSACYDVGGTPNGPKEARARLCRLESCGLIRSYLLNYVTKEMLVSVNNWFNVGQIQHQTAFFKQNFNLQNKAVAKAFQKRVGTSKQAYINDVSLAYSNAVATEIRHIQHHMKEKEKKGGQEIAIEKLQKKLDEKILYRAKFDTSKLEKGTDLFESAEKELLRYNKFPDEKVERRDWDNTKATKAKRPRVGSSGKVELLLEYVDESKKNIPIHDGQFASIKYRYEMIKSLDKDVRERNKNVKISNYAPTKSITPSFITIDKAQLPKLLSLEDGRTILRLANRHPLEQSPKDLNFFFDNTGRVINQIPEIPTSTTETTSASSSSSHQSTPPPANKTPPSSNSAIPPTSSVNNEEARIEEAEDDGTGSGSEEDSDPKPATQDTAKPPTFTTEWGTILKNIDLNDAMHFLFHKKVIKRFVANRRIDGKKRLFGNSFQADPVQLCLKIITEDEVINNKKKQSNFRAKKKKNAEEKKEQEKKRKEREENETEGEREENETEEDTPGDVTIGGIEIVPTKPDEKTIAKINKSIADQELIKIGKKQYKVQQLDGSFWGIDFGLCMLFGAAHSTNAFPPMTISRKEFNNNVGVLINPVCKRRILRREWNRT